MALINSLEEKDFPQVGDTITEISKWDKDFKCVDVKFASGKGISIHAAPMKEEDKTENKVV